MDSTGKIKKTIQDSPKEDFILCPDCEKYFSVIETEVAQEIKNLHSNIGYSVTETLIFENTKIQPKIFHLFHITQFWRVSISNLDIFKWFTLPKETENYLKDELNKFNALNKIDFYKRLSSNNLNKLIPYGVFTSIDFTEKERNLIIISDISDPYCLLADKFGLALYSNIKKIPKNNIELYNTDIEHRKISVLSALQWESIINKPMNILGIKHPI